MLCLKKIVEESLSKFYVLTISVFNAQKRQSYEIVFRTFLNIYD